ncbi:MAG: FAD-containing oxidoreductase [Gammaproteobacteria bacterium]|nr:FAD-containing oxidoreductase [Gammaproteobacteria bacterium]
MRVDSMSEEQAEQALFSESDLEDITARIRAVVDVQDRTYGFPKKSYPQCFVGSDAVANLIDSNIASDAKDALSIGNMLLSAGVFHHVQRAHEFKNEYLFYRFSNDEDHGTTGTGQDGSKVSWSDFIPSVTRESGLSLQPHLPELDPGLSDLAQVDLDTCGVSPLDEHNSRLLDNVHPKNWVDPTPKKKYNLVALGGGAGGLITSGGAASLGGTSALIESHLLGGDCLNVGCVPSKALLSCAKKAHSVRTAEKFGVEISGKVNVDFSGIMERLRKLRADISPVDSAERYAGEKGVDVFIGKGKFTGTNTIEVNGRTLHFSKAIIATGGSPAIPAIPGIESVPYLTNANLFNLTELPRRLAVIGVGPIGLELAQAFQRFGSDVTAFSRSGQIMPKEDPEAAQVVADSMGSDGVRFQFRVKYRSVTRTDDGIRLVYDQGGIEKTQEADALLVAIGRKPNVDGLGLEMAGIDFDPRKGVAVNDRLQTSNPSVYAVGDVATQFQFTHVSDFMARIALRNALAFGRDKFSSLLIPWATYTDPEVAHVGLYEKDLIDRGIDYATYSRHFDDVDRSIVDGDTTGFVKIHVKKGSAQILGATIVGSHAGDLISEVTVAMQSGMGLGSLASVIHPYPTVAEAIRQCGDAYNSFRLTPTIRKVLHRLMAFQR